MLSFACAWGNMNIVSLVPGGAHGEACDRMLRG